MAKATEVLPAETKAERAVFQRVGELRAKFQRASKAGQDYLVALLEFASDYSAAWKTLAHKTLRDKLDRDIGVQDRSDAWRSSIRKIGENADWLRKQHKSLPRSIDSLAILARVGEKTSVPLLRAGRITDASSITETRALAEGKKKRVAIAPRRTYDGTLSFSNAHDAARVFADALTTTDATLSVSDKGVLSALKSHLGKDEWEKVADRVR
jgi:hypothetical protein